jgi:hypothetical protein
MRAASRGLRVALLGCGVWCGGACRAGSEAPARPRAEQPVAESAPAVSVDLRAPRWPAGFTAERTMALGPEETAGLASRLGAAPRAIWNHFVKDTSTRAAVQVNVIEARSAADAKLILATVTATPEARERFVVHDRFVVELVRCSPLQRHRLQEGLGLLDRSPRRYHVTARMGLLARGDAQAVNQLFNLLLAERGGGSVPAGAIERIVGTFSFGHDLRVRIAPTSGGLSRYRFTPEPRARRTNGSEEILTFGATKQHHGVPFVELEAEVATRGFTPIPELAPPAAALTAATPRWPTGQPEVQRIVAQLKTADATLTLQRLHGFVEREIRYAGPVGTRDGVATVLERRFGRCWDKADVIVTLLRAAGIPARQVAGWLVGSEGHIWAEAWVKGTGWVAVDATAPTIGVGSGHVPLFTTEDGEMPVLYLERPVITDRATPRAR